MDVRIVILWGWRHRDLLRIGLSIAAPMAGQCSDVPMGFPWISLCSIERNGTIVDGSKAHAAESGSATYLMLGF